MCGDGRVAAALSRMNFKGKYVGFDINKYRINALLHFFKNNKNYNFNHLIFSIHTIIRMEK